MVMTEFFVVMMTPLAAYTGKAQLKHYLLSSSLKRAVSLSVKRIMPEVWLELYAKSQAISLFTPYYDLNSKS
jgi:hypothetical protein